jgi:hypothetical protein
MRATKTLPALCTRKDTGPVLCPPRIAGKVPLAGVERQGRSRLLLLEACCGRHVTRTLPPCCVQVKRPTRQFFKSGALAKSMVDIAPYVCMLTHAPLPAAARLSPLLDGCKAGGGVGRGRCRACVWRYRQSAAPARLPLSLVALRRMMDALTMCPRFVCAAAGLQHPRKGHRRRAVPRAGRGAAAQAAVGPEPGGAAVLFPPLCAWGPAPALRRTHTYTRTPSQPRTPATVFLRMDYCARVRPPHYPSARCTCFTAPCFCVRARPLCRRRTSSYRCWSCTCALVARGAWRGKRRPPAAALVASRPWLLGPGSGVNGCCVGGCLRARRREREGK